MLNILLSVCLGALLAHLFWRERFREMRTADYFREVLEKLISPFYLWLLSGRIRTRDRRVETSVSPEELNRMIVFNSGEDDKIVEILKSNVHLASIDSRLFDQVKEFLACYQFNYGQQDTRERIYRIYQVMEALLNEYSQKYSNIMLLREKPFWKKWKG